MDNFLTSEELYQEFEDDDLVDYYNNHDVE